MDYADRLEISYYNTIATINSEHKIYLVQHRESGKIYIKKILDVYNQQIYNYLMSHHISGTPRLYNIYEENGQLILIEEFISGVSLQEMLHDRSVSLDLIIQIMDELCSILDKLHSLNPPIIHRDIKPSNLIITPCGHVVLIDFNAAKYLTCAAERDTVLLGTKGYAAPEQYGFGSSTPQTDIYALGILLKELSASLPVPTNVFDVIINKCTEINPSDRMKNVRDLKTEIDTLQNHNNSKLCLPHKKFVLPGFRTKTPWKMLTASIVYLLITWLCLSIKIKEASVFHLWLERIISLLMMLSFIFCCFNYCNIRCFMPLCKSKHRPVRYLGVIILYLAIAFSLLIIMLILESIF